MGGSSPLQLTLSGSRVNYKASVQVLWERRRPVRVPVARKPDLCACYCKASGHAKQQDMLHHPMSIRPSLMWTCYPPHRASTSDGSKRMVGRPRCPWRVFRFPIKTQERQHVLFGPPRRSSGGGWSAPSLLVQSYEATRKARLPKAQKPSCNHLPPTQRLRNANLLSLWALPT